jgi:hypothetical protein
MASEFTRRPRLLKGALVAYQSQMIPGIPRLVVFQYNPENLTRTLRHQRAQRRGAWNKPDSRESLEVTGPPAESISMTVTLDAADQLEFPAENPVVVGTGLHPALATLELLLYPPSQEILASAVRASLGSRSVKSMDVPLVLLVWGAPRVVPVRLDGLSVTEQAFDNLLNPTRAEVRLDLTVLSYDDLETGTLGHGVSLVHHVAKEALAVAHQVKTAIEIGSLPF